MQSGAKNTLAIFMATLASVFGCYNLLIHHPSRSVKAIFIIALLIGVIYYLIVEKSTKFKNDEDSWPE